MHKVSDSLARARHWYAYKKLSFFRGLGERLTQFRNQHPHLYHRNKLYYLPEERSGAQPHVGKRAFVHNDLFPETPERPWLDRDDSGAIVKRRLDRGEITREQADACFRFAEDGYYISKGLVSEQEADGCWMSYLRAISRGHIAPNAERRILNPHLHAPVINGLLRNPDILGFVRLFLGERNVIPFQSIGSQWGSQQPAHSDAIHMTTYPLGYLVAAWVACEDVVEGSGPLFYYPGSHRLPYALSREVGFHPRDYHTKGRWAVYNETYEPYIQNLILEHDLKPKYFYAKKGDVLFWHHNLLHGGSRITDESTTRRAFVFHYYAKRAVCYHELFGGLADVRL